MSRHLMVISPGRARLLVVAAALAYLLVDGHPESWLNGLPWRPLSLAVAVVGGVAAWVLWPRQVSPPLPRTETSAQPMFAPRNGGGWGVRASSGVRLPFIFAASILILTAARGVVGWQALPSGLPGWYFDNSRFQGDFERSTDFLGEPWTRREREIDFGGDEFPTFFLNDVQRFNFYGSEAERRKNLPFSARWDGFLYVPAGGSYQLWLTASGPAALRIGDRQVAAVDADGRQTAVVTLDLAAGSHPVRLTYARRPPRSPDLKLEWSLDGRRQPIRVPYWFPASVTPAQWEADRTWLTASRALDAAFLVLVGVGAVLLSGLAVRRFVRLPAARWPILEHVLLGVWLLAVFWTATVPRLDRVDKMALLGGGQDWLTHETFARDILIGGPLMTLGKPLGEGRTFYAQPFYPYALAAFHALTGEDQFGALAIQVLGSALTGVLLYFLAKRLFGQWAALATFVLYLPLWKWHLEWVAYRLISEAIYFAILPALLLILVRLLDERRARDLILGGVLLGLAIVTRGPTLLYVPFVGAILWWGLRRTGLARAVVARQLAVLAFAMALAIGLVPIRNQLVAGQPSLLASSGGVNLQKLHRPSNGVRLGVAQERWFAPFIGDAPTRETVEFLLQDPAGYAWACVLLAAYTLGYGAAVEESTITVWPELILFNLLYLLAIILLARARSPRALLLHAFVLIHFATMVIFVPYDYDNRLVLPMYLPIIVFGGYLLATVIQRAAAPLTGRMRADATVAASGLTLATDRGRLTGVATPREDVR
ncbi:MAG: glycosyltransferase family 39 protein [Chloroflexi bacterium]|nr:glycosyltransferase family 39 protein [Chloroflexota bacterium]